MSTFIGQILVTCMIFIKLISVISMLATKSVSTIVVPKVMDRTNFSVSSMWPTDRYSTWFTEH